jgi:hypothetical protein
VNRLERRRFPALGEGRSVLLAEGAAAMMILADALRRLHQQKLSITGSTI